MIEILAILSTLILIGVVCYLGVYRVVKGANTGRHRKSWEKRFAEQEAAVKKERSNKEMWDILKCEDWSSAPFPALCSACKEDGGEGKLFDILSRDPVEKFMYQATQVLHNLCIQCGDRVDEDD